MDMRTGYHQGASGLCWCEASTLMNIYWQEKDIKNFEHKKKIIKMSIEEQGTLKDQFTREIFQTFLPLGANKKCIIKIYTI